MDWKRSSRCNFEKPQCVEVAAHDDGVAIRDSKLGEGSPIVQVDLAAWQALLSHVKC